MRSGARHKLADRLEMNLEFYKGWLGRSRTIGAIAPTSRTMARIMAREVQPDSDLPALEFGPGAGAITRAILETGLAPEKLVSVEYCAHFLPGLRRRHPGVNFVHGDAFDIAAIARDLGIGQFSVILSALPLLTFPLIQRVRFVDRALDLLAPGRPLVQFSYGLRPPAPTRASRYEVSHMDTVLRNLPPARIWTYRRAPACEMAANRA